MTAFTPREAARDAFSAARSMGRSRVMGEDPQATLAARQAVWRRVSALVDRAVGTDLVLVREPSDATLKLMGDAAEEQIARLEEQGRRATAVARDVDRSTIVENAGRGIGPRTWTMATGPIETEER